jgi:formate hydrogenlyase transcriptional activator
MADVLGDGEMLTASRQDRALRAVAEAIVSHRDVRALFADLARRLQRVVPFDCLCLRLADAAGGTLRLHARNAPRSLPPPVAAVPVVGDPAGWVWQTQQPLVISDLAEETRWPGCLNPDQDRLVSLCIVPLTTARRRLGTLAFGCTRAGALDARDGESLRPAAGLVALAVENILAFGEIAELKEKREQEKVYLEEEICSEHDGPDIVGESAALRQVLLEVRTVAPTDAAVLIRGETGTGKELVARALHQLSARRERAFLKLNCAAIPTGLLESELFGHEKGAFTGAIAQKVGRFELADGGTLFLDEVGDIPLELQPKLLRVLQDQEFERLGSTQTRRVNVRLVAATNRDLPQMMAEGRFRSDLYYRLNVFPVVLPPLRERRDDIPRLARHLTQRFARHLGKCIEVISAESLDALARYDWPGNIRELENVIERAVILSPGPELSIPPSYLQSPAAPGHRRAGSAVTLADLEREHILAVLRETSGVLGGPQGAAARLGLNRSTLRGKMRKLGITRPG